MLTLSLPMAHGFLYLVAILDVASRKVLAFRLSNTLTADFCVEALEEAIAKCRGAGDFQHRSRIAIHQRGVDNASEGRRRCDQHGWQGSLDRQHLYRALVAQRTNTGLLCAYTNGTEARMGKLTRYFSPL